LHGCAEGQKPVTAAACFAAHVADLARSALVPRASRLVARH
jgi:hypothetical protein